MADLDPINPPTPIKPPGAQQRLPERRRQERRRRPEVPADGATDDAGERRDPDPLVDDYA